MISRNFFFKAALLQKVMPIWWFGIQTISELSAVKNTVNPMQMLMLLMVSQCMEHLNMLLPMVKFYYCNYCTIYCNYCTIYWNYCIIFLCNNCIYIALKIGIILIAILITTGKVVVYEYEMNPNVSQGQVLVAEPFPCILYDQVQDLDELSKVWFWFSRTFFLK